VKARKDKVAVKAVTVDPTEGMNHIQIANYLVKVGPFMHGTPSPRKGR
jgi:hypothetical protein